MEADLYALKTLKLLNTHSKSIQTLLETIEQKLLNKGFSKDDQRVSTHPYFEDRILLIKNFEENKTNNLNESYNKRFNYIKAKFVGYTDSEEVLSELNEPYKAYAESIKLARTGNLKMSLQNLNEIIKKYNNKNILLKYFEIAKKLNKNEWLDFFNFFLSINDMEKEVFNFEIKNFKSTKDSDLLKLVNIIENLN